VRTSYPEINQFSVKRYGYTTITGREDHTCNSRLLEMRNLIKRAVGLHVRHDGIHYSCHPAQQPITLKVIRSFTRVSVQFRLPRKARDWASETGEANTETQVPHRAGYECDQTSSNAHLKRLIKIFGVDFAGAAHLLIQTTVTRVLTHKARESFQDL
jgi:hypothetical protein